MARYTLDYLELPSTDTSGSGAFFKTAFGWEPVTYGPSYSEIRGGGLVFGVNADAADASRATMPVIRTDDLDAAYKAVLAAGGVITREPYDFPGGRRFFFREPGGAELALYTTTE